MSAQTIDFQADPRAHRESGFVPQYTPPEAAAARAATNRESFLPWTTLSISQSATCPTGSLRSPSRACFPSSTPSAEPARFCSPNEPYYVERLAAIRRSALDSQRRSHHGLKGVLNEEIPAFLGQVFCENTVPPELPSTLAPAPQA